MLLLLALALAVLSLPALAAAAPISVVLIGDSITAGVVSEPVGPPYVALLADSLGAGYAVSSIGCGGSSSIDWTISQGDVFCASTEFRLPNIYEALAVPLLPADFVAILLGTNDALGYFEPEPVSADAYRAAIEEIAGNLLADGAGQVLLMTPPPNFRNLFTNHLLGEYRDEILAACDAPEDAVLCGPDLYSLLTPSDFELDDIHPNGAGHQKIADALRDTITATAVPEPGSGLLLGLGLALGLVPLARGAG